MSFGGPVMVSSSSDVRVLCTRDDERPATNRSSPDNLNDIPLEDALAVRIDGIRMSRPTAVRVAVPHVDGVKAMVGRHNAVVVAAHTARRSIEWRNSIMLIL